MLDYALPPAVDGLRLHISLGRDLKINLDGTPSNDVDVLGTQLEEVIE